MLKIKVFVQDKFIKSKDFSPDMILAYLGLRKLMVKDINEYFVCVGLLSYCLLGKQSVNQLINNSIINGLIELITNGCIIHVDSGDAFKRRSNEYVLNLSNIQINKIKGKETKDYYTSIELDYIVKILNSNLKEKISLLRFYCYLLTTICKTGLKEGVGFTSYENMATVIGICRQTISKYMNTLESLGLIHIYRSNDAIVKNGIVHEIPNTYGDISNKDKINNIGSDFEENYGENAKKIKSTKKSSGRSASAKYNIILSDLKTTGEIRYDNGVMKEIYKTLVEHNKKYSYDNSLQKDLSVFSNFDFYESEVNNSANAKE